MTESQIEYRVQRMIDHLDALYLKSDMTSEQYELEMSKIKEWADTQYNITT